MPSAQLERLTSEVMELVPQPELGVIERRTARRRTRRRVAAATLSVAVLAPAAALALSTIDRNGPDLSATATPASCRVAGELALPAGYTEVGVGGADRTGRYLIGTGLSGRDRTIHAVWWHDGVPATAGATGMHLVPVAVNTAGVVAGFARSVSAPGEGPAWVHDGHRLRVMPAPAGYGSASVAGINERGDVAGYALDPSGAGVAVVWPTSPPGEPRVLAAPEPARVDGIGDDGTVIGRLFGGQPITANSGRGYVWHPDGSGRELALPAGWSRAQASHVQAGRIFGYVDRKGAAGDEVALARWSLDGGSVEVLSRVRGGLDGTTATGWGVVWGPSPVLANVDGTVREVTGHDEATGARMVRGGGAVWVGADGGGLAVVGNALSASGVTRPVRWRCGA